MPSFVISKLTRCRLLALLAGLVFSFALAFVTLLVCSVTYDLAPLMPAWELTALRTGIIWLLAVPLAGGLAVILGPYDLLVIGTFVVPALFYFGVNYLGSILLYLPDNGGMYTIFGGSGPPIGWRGHLYLNEHLWVLSYSLAWGLITACAGIALKRGLLRSKRGVALPILSPSATRSLWLSLILDVSLLFLVVFAILGIDEVHRAGLRSNRGPWSENFDRKLKAPGSGRATAFSGGM